MVDIDKTNISSQILLDNWEYISRYYFVIEKEVDAIRNDNISEDEFFNYMSYPEKLFEELYKESLDSIKELIIEYLTGIHKYSYKLRKPEAITSLKVIDLIYMLYSDDEFYLRAEPSRTFYDTKYSKLVPEFEIKHKFKIVPSEILFEILNELNISCDDYSEIFPDTHGFFAELMFECWSFTKINSDLLCIMVYGTGGIDYNLDTGERIDEFHVEEYYNTKGIVIEKD